MTTRTPPSKRRTDALSRQRIVAATVEILDRDGENGLNVRSLARHFATGSGAIYHHVPDKDDLLAAAAGEVVVAGTTTGGEDLEPRAAIRAAALGLFDAIHAHPWVGAQLSRAPWQRAVVDILEAFGGPLTALGVPARSRFDCATALVNYVLGLAGQYAAAARVVTHETTRAGFLAEVAERWLQLDADRYPFVRQVAPQLSSHDDREQFLAGIDLILAGITAVG